MKLTYSFVTQILKMLLTDYRKYFSAILVSKVLLVSMVAMVRASAVIVALVMLTR
jgi:hypothetical protein